MKCEAHPDREGALAVDLPSLGIKRHLCAECKAELDARLARTPFKGRREAWECCDDYTLAGGAYFVDTISGRRQLTPYDKDAYK